MCFNHFLKEICTLLYSNLVIHVNNTFSEIVNFIIKKMYIQKYISEKSTNPFQGLLL